MRSPASIHAILLVSGTSRDPNWLAWPCDPPLAFVCLCSRADAISRVPGTHILTVITKTPVRPRRGLLQSESSATTRKLHCKHQNNGRRPLNQPPAQGPHLPHLQRPGRRVPGRREHQPPRAPRRAAADPDIGPAGDALYVATDPNHRTVHRFDAAGNLVRAERCADEAPNYLLCV